MIRLERRWEEVKEAVINHHTQFLQPSNVQRRGKGLAEENPGLQDCEREARLGVVISSPSFLSCSQAPKVPCVSSWVLGNYSTWQGIQSPR